MNACTSDCQCRKAQDIMVQSPEERGCAPQASMSQAEGGAQGVTITNGLSPNAEVQQRALQRYQRLLKSDPQLQVTRPYCQRQHAP